MKRLQKFREQLSGLKVDGMLITNRQNRCYLSGFTGSAGVLAISREHAYLVTDFRYWEQVGQEVKDFELYKQGPNLWQSVMELIHQCGWRRIGFEAGGLTYQEYQNLSGLATDLEWVPLTDLVERQRRVKDQHEVELLAQAARITDQAWQKTLSIIKPGVQEREIALEFDYQIRLGGAEGNSFTTIVASGWRAALPHGAAGEKQVIHGDLVIIDGGALFQGYCADMTRTVVLGKATPEQTKVYQVVLEAQQRALDYLKAGLIGNAVDKVARDYLNEQGYGANFGHGLGHSVGLEIHENPRLSITEQNRIPAGAAITVEPGVYLPNWGGVRIEDLVVVETEGIRNLTGSPKQSLLEL